MRRTKQSEGWGKRRAVRIALWSLVGTVLVTAGATGVAIWQNSYDIREERVSVRHAGRTLDGVLALPQKGRGPFGLVVFIHGDGPIDATHETFYRPMWESFARAGYASLSWNKPGVAGSEGDWLRQSMADRAQEAADAIAWARQRPDVDAGRIGLWGASQAGWVLPKVAALDPGLRFVIAVSPAVNWQQQGRHNLLAQLREDGASPVEIDAALRRRETTLQLLRRGAPFEEYTQAVGDPEGMTADRWGFIARNHTSDATADLRAMRGTPVLLVLAGHDVNVDVVDTEVGYREALPPSTLRVARYPDATHSLVKYGVERSGIKLTATAVFAPRALFAKGFLDDQRGFVERLDTPGRQADGPVGRVRGR